MSRRRTCLRRRPTFLLVAAAVAATPLLAAAAEPSPCGALLTGLARVAAASGYDVMNAVDEIVGVDVAENELRARCDDYEHAVVEFVATDGARVDIEVSSGASSLTGSFPGYGRVSQDWTVDATGSGRVRFAAETGLATASAELDIASGAWAFDGDAVSMNAWFQPALTASSLWKDAHLLVLMLTGVWTAGLTEDPSGLDAMLELAVPTTVTGDVDKGDLKKEWGSTIGVCTVAIFWEPATVACIGQGVKCFAAFKCWKNDCSGDGKA